jgi:hypothetical protein
MNTEQFVEQPYVLNGRMNAEQPERFNLGTLYKALLKIGMLTVWS